MPKRTTSFHLALAVPAAHMPAQRWLYSTIRAQLPSTRELARVYGLSRGTIVGGFEQLAAEGYLEGITGSGTRVSETVPEDWLSVRRYVATNGTKRKLPKRHLSRYARQITLFRGYDQRVTRAFSSNLPGLDMFPVELWTPKGP